MNRQKALRFMYYIFGMLILALGITLNTKTGLGVSPIISVPYSISQITHINFGNMTLLIYCVFVLLELILKGKSAKPYDCLQIPLSIVFTRFMNLFAAYIDIPLNNFFERLVLLIIAVILTGIGAAMSLDMRLVPNPGDGIVQAIADKINREVGFTKNCFDLLNITITIAVSFVFTGKPIGIGVGTVIAVIGVGRTVAAFNRIFKERMCVSAGF